jgi:BASS family bile acid:Na+ symporter
MITPAILLMMMLSMMEIDLRAKCNLYDMLMGFGINYLLLSGLIIGLSFFPQDENLRQGFIVMADVPPAVAILPLTKLLDDDSRISLYAETVCYLASLILNPSSSSPSPTVLE